MSTQEIDYRTLDLKEAFRIFTLVRKADPNKETEIIYKKVRYGKNGNGFDIYDALNGYITEKPKSQLITCGMITMKRKEYWSEIEERGDLVRGWLDENMKTKTFTVARTLEEEEN